MNQLLTLFPNLVYCCQLANVDNSYLANLAYTIRSGTGSAMTSQWNCPTYNTMGQWDWSQANDAVVDSLVQRAGQQVYTLADQLGEIDPAYELECCDLWFNIAEPGAYQELHLHTGTSFSLVYYITAPADSGDLLFSAPNWRQQLPHPIRPRPNAEAKHSVTYGLTPAVGQLVIFESGLEHQVTQNLSGQDRIGITMNFRFVKREPATVI